MHKLLDYITYLGDNALILGHRNSEWCGHGPVLEQDIAITNISLDLIGQARLFYQYVAELYNKEEKTLFDHLLGQQQSITEDHIAYWRNEKDFKNILLVEQPNEDWAHTILRQFLFSIFQQLLYNGLLKSSDKQIAAIVEKALKEVNYHVKWCSEWIVRLGNGTEESCKRMLNAIEHLWMYTNELFEPVDYEIWAVENKIGINVSLLQDDWMKKLKETFVEANLPIPTQKGWQKGGKIGKHTEYLGYILTEMQYMQKTYPGCVW